MIEAGTLDAMREARYAGWDGELGRRHPVRRDLVRGAGRGGSRPARSTRGRCPAGRSCRERREPAHLGRRGARADRDRRRSLSVGLVLGIDVSTTATKAVLIDEDGSVRGVGTAEYGFDVPHPLWSEQDPGLWWDGAVAAIGSVLRSTGRDRARTSRRSG